MARTKNTILTYLVLLLLAAALIASGKLINSLSSEPEKDYATKLAKLRADLIKAAESGYKPQPSSSNKTGTSTRRSPKERPT